MCKIPIVFVFLCIISSTFCCDNLSCSDCITSKGQFVKARSGLQCLKTYNHRMGVKRIYNLADCAEFEVVKPLDKPNNSDNSYFLETTSSSNVFKTESDTEARYAVPFMDTPPSSTELPFLTKIYYPPELPSVNVSSAGRELYPKTYSPPKLPSVNVSSASTELYPKATEELTSTDASIMILSSTTEYFPSEVSNTTDAPPIFFTTAILSPSPFAISVTGSLSTLKVVEDEYEMNNSTQVQKSEENWTDLSMNETYDALFNNTEIEIPLCENQTLFEMFGLYVKDDEIVYKSRAIPFRMHKRKEAWVIRYLRNCCWNFVHITKIMKEDGLDTFELAYYKNILTFNPMREFPELCKDILDKTMQ